MMPARGMGRLGFAQDRGEHVAAVNGPPQVDAQGPRPIVQRHIADGGATGTDTGVVDHQRGRCAEPGLRLLGQIDARRRIGTRRSGSPPLRRPVR